MASTSTPPSGVSAIAAAQTAFQHTRRSLFPIRVRTWLILGLLAFLDQCGRTFHWAGGAPGDSGGRGWSQGESRGFREDLAEALSRAAAWLSAHAVEVALGAIVGALLIGGIVAAVLWLNARGTFAYLHSVATGRAALAGPWRRHARAAHSYFGWRLGLALAGLLVILLIAGIVLVAVFGIVRGRLEGTAGALAVLALAPVLAVLLLALPLLALAALALRDFVAPLQLATGLSCGVAARVLEGLVIQHPGAFLVYLLLKLVVVAVTGGVVIVGGCLTCCLGYLPIVLQTLFQPLFFFERSLSVSLLAQMGHDVAAKLAD